MGAYTPIAVPRRIEALAYIIEQIQRFGSCPSYEEIGAGMVPPVGKSRTRELINELIELGVIERSAASRRGIRIRDIQRCREMINEALGVQGWSRSQALGELEPPCTFEHLPLLTLIELPPDVD